MIVTVGNTKGGVGKTTVALNLAVARALQGRDVWLIDGDRQGTAQTAVSLRADAGRTPMVACSQYVEGPTLRAQVMQQRGKYQDIIIDAGGRDSTALRAALTLSDVVLIPFQPRSFDVWALADISALLEEARSVRDDITAHAFLNCADISGTDNTEASEALADYPALMWLDAPLRRRKSVASAAGQGLSVLEYAPKDAKACAELEALISIVF